MSIETSQVTTSEQIRNFSLGQIGVRLTEVDTLYRDLSSGNKGMVEDLLQPLRSEKDSLVLEILRRRNEDPASAINIGLIYDQKKGPERGQVEIRFEDSNNIYQTRFPTPASRTGATWDSIRTAIGERYDYTQIR